MRPLGAVLTGTLSPEQLYSWGWRVPFIFGLSLGPIAYYIRTRLDETPEFLASETTTTPLRDAFASQKTRLLIAMLLHDLRRVGESGRVGRGTPQAGLQIGEGVSTAVAVPPKRR